MEELTNLVKGWRDSSAATMLREGIKNFYNIPQIRNTFQNESHVEKTPQRIVNTMLEMFDGCFENPEQMLLTSFEEQTYDELVYVNGIPFVSNCAHHNLPFFG